MAYQRTGTPGIFTRGETYYIAGRDPITKRLGWTKAGTSLQEAKGLKRQLDDQRARGVSTRESRLTVPELWALFEAEHLAGLSPSTQADYSSAYRRYIEPRYAKARVVDITRAEIKSFRAQLAKTRSSRGAPLSPKRIRNVMLVAQSLWSYAVATDRADDNPVAEARRGERSPATEARDYALTPAEAEGLLGAIRQVNPAHEALFLLLTRTGARLSEALALPVSAVDLSRRTIRIDRSVYRGQLKSTKTGLGRTVGIDDELHEVLLEHLRDKTDLAFPSRRNGYIDPNGLRRHVWEPAKAKSNLPPELKANLHIHDLRHSWCSWMVAGGMDLRSVMACSGHRSFQSLLRYTHTTGAGAAQRSVQVLNGLASE